MKLLQSLLIAAMIVFSFMGLAIYLTAITCCYPYIYCLLVFVALVAAVHNLRK